MLELGVDEVTIVLQDASDIETDSISDTSYSICTQWEIIAEEIINTFAEKASFEHIFGRKLDEPKAPAGYTKAYHYGYHNFYLALAYHPEHPTMGVVVKFSAQALDYYCEQCKLELYQLMFLTSDKRYSARISRIDLTADYIDENIDVADINQDLSERKIGIYDKFDGRTPDEPIYRQRNLTNKSFCVNNRAQTLYIGSATSNSQLRIYDKRQEQIETKGSKFQKALATQNWGRFELILRNDYAHSISDALTRINTDTKYKNLIASTIVQKARFMVIENGLPDHATDFTQMLIDCIYNNDFRLKAHQHDNYELAKSIEYLYRGSGIMSTLCKIEAIWGREAVWDILSYTLDLLDDYEPSEKVYRWLTANGKDYSKRYPNYRDFLQENLYEVVRDPKQKNGLRELTIKL